MSWRNCVASVILNQEINAKWPNRRRGRDGHIGDAAHQGRGNATDHNPWIKDARGVGVVRARDVDARLDGRNNNADALVNFLVSKARAGDARFRNGGYIIYKGRIFSEKTKFKGERYTKPNKHTTIVHISFSRDVVGFDSGKAWGLSGAPSTSSVLKCGDKGQSVAFLMGLINIAASGGCAIDDKGKTTKAQLRVPTNRVQQKSFVFTCEGHVHVENFQRFLRVMWELAGKNGKAPTVDGIAGPQTTGGLAFWVPIVLQ